MLKHEIERVQYVRIVKHEYDDVYDDVDDDYDDDDDDDNNYRPARAAR